MKKWIVKQNKKNFLAIIIVIGICCVFALWGNRNTLTPEKAEKVILFVESGSRECKEIIIDDCRDEYVDYCKDKRTLLFVNSKNQIIERDIAGEEQVLDIEAVDLTETVSNVQYAPGDESLYFIYENEIYQYSLDDKALTKKTDGIDSTWSRTYIWENDEYGYKLVDNGRFSELYSMDMKEDLEQKVCDGYIRSIGQVQENKVFALQEYSNPTHDSSTVDLRNRIIAIDISNGNIEIIQELGSWMDGNYLFVCNEDDIFYIQKKRKKECLYRVNLNTGSKKKVYSTRNKVIGIAVN